MKLYLSSYRIPVVEPLHDLIDASAAQTKVAVLFNAKDYYADRARAYKFSEIVTVLAQAGFSQVEEVDLRKLRSPNQTRAALANFDMLWVAGGNTFCLREEMKNSGFDIIARELLDSGMVYCGESAGAVAAGTSLRGIESADIPEFAGEVIYEGIGLVDAVILPHADNELFSLSTEATRAANRRADIIEIRDNEVCIVDGSRTKMYRAQSAE